jgi:hypothetical protein
MKKFVVLAATAVLGACAMAEPAPGPGGRPGFAISCPAGDLGVCFAKARELCPSGYTVVSMRRPDSVILPTVFQDQVVVACN